MRLVVRHQALKQILPWIQRALLFSGASLLGYCVFVAADTWAFQRTESRQLERLLLAPTATKAPVSVAADGLIGRITISRLGLSAIIMEGTTARTLRRAVGHIAGTAMPGQTGNVGISGHRDTFFRPLKDIRQDDIITLTTPFGEFRYQVISTKIVRPEDVTVLAPSGREILTLVTCHPFYFVGSAPDRFVVRAQRVT